MAKAEDQLVRARAAAARGDHVTVRDALYSLRAEGGDLGLDDLRLLARACWWLGDGTGSMDVGEQVYRRLDAEGRAADAALQALTLSLEWVTRGDVTLGLAWLGRARRLLADLPPSVPHGYLRYADASFEMDVYGEPGSALEAAQELDALARDHGDPTLLGLARVLDGLAAVRSGRTAEGFGALDEAMIDVVGGRVSPLWAGDIYCTVVHLSHQLGDWGRMRAWTDALERWATPLSQTFLYAGVTRVHQLQLLAAEGQWSRVEAEVGPRSEQLVGSHGWVAGAGYYELGEVRRVTGDRAGAVAAYARARELGVEPQPGEALLALAEGDHRAASAALRAALAGRARLERARLLLAAVRAGIASGDQDLASGSAAELSVTAEHFGTSGLLAWAAHARGLLALAAGDPATAVVELERALAGYRGQRLRYSVATAHEDLAAARRALGDHAAASADLATALAAYRQLGAHPDVERLEPTTRAGGLTAREVEVLACVAAGASNREVAQRLFISEKTVSRHLANIFAKLGVGSRTAASAWAHEQGVHGPPEHGVHGSPHTAG